MNNLSKFMLDHIGGNQNTCKNHYQGSASKTKPVWLTVVFVFVVLSNSVNHTVFLFSFDVVLWIFEFARKIRKKMNIWAKNFMKNTKRVEKVLQVLQITSLVCCIGIVFKVVQFHVFYFWKRNSSYNHPTRFDTITRGHLRMVYRASISDSYLQNRTCFRRGVSALSWSESLLTPCLAVELLGSAKPFRFAAKLEQNYE